MFQLSRWSLPRYFKCGTKSMILNYVDQFDNIIKGNVFIKMQQKEIKITLLFSKITSKIILWIKDANTQNLRHRMMVMPMPTRLLAVCGSS